MIYPMQSILNPQYLYRKLIEIFLENDASANHSENENQLNKTFRNDLTVVSCFGIYP